MPLRGDIRPPACPCRRRPPGGGRAVRTPVAASRTSWRPRTAGPTSSTSSDYPEAVARPVAVPAALCIGARRAPGARRLRVPARLLRRARGGHRGARRRRTVVATARTAPTLADEAGQALVAGDLDDYGRVLTAATEAQAALHPALISDAAQRADGHRPDGRRGRVEGQRCRRRRWLDQHPRSHPRRSRRGSSTRPSGSATPRSRSPSPAGGARTGEGGRPRCGSGPLRPEPGPSGQVTLMVVVDALQLLVSFDSATTRRSSAQASSR